MVDRFEVVWAPAARSEFLEILRYIAGRNAMAARSVKQRLNASASTLEHHPQRGRRVPEVASLPESVVLTRGAVLRELIVRPWRLVYAVEQRHVSIVAVVDSRRDMVAWLEQHRARL